MESLKNELRDFVVKNFLFGRADGLADDTSFMEAGIIDSTGVLELVAHLEEGYGVTIDDTELTPDNFDSIEAIAGYLARKKPVPTP